MTSTNLQLAAGLPDVTIKLLSLGPVLDRTQGPLCRAPAIHPPVWISPTCFITIRMLLAKIRTVQCPCLHLHPRPLVVPWADVVSLASVPQTSVTLCLASLPPVPGLVPLFSIPPDLPQGQRHPHLASTSPRLASAGVVSVRPSSTPLPPPLLQTATRIPSASARHLFLAFIPFPTVMMSNVFRYPGARRPQRWSTSSRQHPRDLARGVQETRPC